MTGTEERDARALVVGGDGLRVERVAYRDPGAGEVRIDVAWCGVCGSDLRYLDAGAMPEGTVLGHELAGTVAALGSGVRGLGVGTPVVLNPFTPCDQCRECRNGLGHICPTALRTYVGGGERPGGYAAEVIASASGVVPIPSGLDPRIAALTEPLAVAVRAVRLAGDRAPGVPTVVLGAGPIGMLCGLVLQQERTPFAVVSTNPERARLATALGMPVVTADQLDTVFDDGVGAIIETAGRPGTLALSIDAVRPGGTVVAVGIVQQHEPIDPVALVTREVTVRGSLGYSDEEFREALAMLAEQRLDVTPLITREFAVDEGPDVVAGLRRGGSAELKVLLRR